jgi:hypothetical protein
MDDMTDQRIEKCRQRLIDIRRMSDSGDRNKAYIELSAELGASGCGKDMTPGERDAEYIRGINQALQTASIINMCKTAARGYEVAIEASRSASRTFWIMAAIAFLSAVAAWVAAIRT